MGMEGNEIFPMYTNEGESRKNEYRYVLTTRSTCFKCVKEYPDEMRLVDAEVFIRDGKVYLRKLCPEHGLSYALKNSDADWYLKTFLPENIRAGAPISEFQTEEKKGCPYDCGLCPSHHQHSCAAVIDITGNCDMNCPVCDARSSRKSPYFMSPGEFDEILDMLINTNQTLQALVFSGGEPSLHPQLFDFIDSARKREEITRIDMLTGGMRISRDEGFVERLASYNPYVYANLSFDGFTSEPYTYIRGKDFLEMKLKALEQLKKYQINTIVQVIVARGQNEDQIGKIILELIDEPFIRGFIFQPLIWAKGAPDDIVDPMDRVTMPDILKAIEEQTSGLLTQKDFFNACEYFECQQWAYVWSGKKRTRSLRTIIPKDVLMEVTDSEKLFRPEKVKSIVLERRKFVDGPDQRDKDEMAKWEKFMKFVNVHHYMDAHDFDVTRLKKCCFHMSTPSPKKLLRPVCVYNLFSRDQDERYGNNVM
jgi:uncharacterized radical SAM superfamily Fe-S cluster-containing enzyme